MKNQTKKLWKETWAMDRNCRLRLRFHVSLSAILMCQLQLDDWKNYQYQGQFMFQLALYIRAEINIFTKKAHEVSI